MSDNQAGGATMIAETSRVGKRGTIVIPAAIRRRLRIEEGAFVIVEEREDGVLIRPAAVMPIEMYTAERRAEFLLSNAIDSEDYARAREEVRRMGLDPDAIPHYAAGGD
jgi:AbrB family looped-hinge helix DNA binding protein